MLEGARCEALDVLGQVDQSENVDVTCRSAWIPHAGKLPRGSW